MIDINNNRDFRCKKDHVFYYNILSFIIMSMFLNVIFIVVAVIFMIEAICLYCKYIKNYVFYYNIFKLNILSIIKMSMFWNIIFISILLLLLIIAAIFIIEANILLSSHKNDNKKLQTAYLHTFSAAFITITLIIIFIVLIILSIFGISILFNSSVNEEEISFEDFETKQNLQIIPWLTAGILLFILIIVIVAGSLSAAAAWGIKNSSNFNPSIKNLNNAFSSCILATSMYICVGSLIIIGTIAYIIIEHEKQKIVGEAKQEYLINIIKDQSIYL